jgi:RimJ/RimL family protein N-acetyltransferase
MPEAHPVLLAPLRPEDCATLFEWINDRDSVRLNSSYRPVHPDAHASWFQSVQNRSDMAMFAIRSRAEDRLIGTCQLLAIHPVHRSAELQIRLGDPAARGQGFGTAAVRLLAAFGFEDLNLHRIYLNVFADNLRAQACYAKAGFVEEGRAREAAWIGGRWVDQVTMGLLRSDWKGPA